MSAGGLDDDWSAVVLVSRVNGTIAVERVDSVGAAVEEVVMMVDVVVETKSEICTGAGDMYTDRVTSLKSTPASLFSASIPSAASVAPCVDACCMFVGRFVSSGCGLFHWRLWPWEDLTCARAGSCVADGYCVCVSSSAGACDGCGGLSSSMEESGKLLLTRAGREP